MEGFSQNAYGYTLEKCVGLEVFFPFAFQGETQKISKTTIIMISTLCWYITSCCNDNMPRMIVSLQ
jgi:hypothetical protein